jgi:hypothetical protein
LRPLEVVEVVNSARARSLGPSQLERTLRASSARNIGTGSFSYDGELPKVIEKIVKSLSRNGHGELFESHKRGGWGRDHTSRREVLTRRGNEGTKNRWGMNYQ